MLLVEEGQPDYIEQNLNTILRRAGSDVALHGKDMLPMAGEYTAAAVTRGLGEFLEPYLPRRSIEHDARAVAPADDAGQPVRGAGRRRGILPRPPGLLHRLPGAPDLHGLKLAERETGAHHVSADIGCHLFSITPPFNIGATTMGYGLGSAAAAALNSKDADRRTIAMMGDGGFWHNGLTTGVGNAVFNQNDSCWWSSTTTTPPPPAARTSSPRRPRTRAASTQHPIEKAVRGVGVEWARTIDDTYDVGAGARHAHEALTTDAEGPEGDRDAERVQLNRQRRVKPEMRQALKEGKRVVRERFGVDEDTCTGDHACIRISGCPSLTIKPNPDPLRHDPVATVDRQLRRLRRVRRQTPTRRCSARRSTAPTWSRTRPRKTSPGPHPLALDEVASRGIERRAARFEAA